MYNINAVFFFQSDDGKIDTFNWYNRVNEINFSLERKETEVKMKKKN